MKHRGGMRRLALISGAVSGEGKMRNYRMRLFMLVIVGYTYSVPAIDPLEWVEQDQAGEALSSHDIFNRNMALDAMRSYTHVSSYRRGAFGHLAHDGGFLFRVYAVQEARANNQETLDLVLIREVYWPEENTDAVSAILSSREAGPERSPKVHVW